MTPAVHQTCPLFSPCVALRRIRILNNKQKSVSVSSKVTKYLFLAGPATEGLLRQRDDESLYFQPRLHRCKSTRGRSAKRQLSWKADQSIDQSAQSHGDRGIHVPYRLHVAKTSQISGDSGERLSKGRDRYIKPDRTTHLSGSYSSRGQRLMVKSSSSHLDFRKKRACPRKGSRHRFEQTRTRSRY